MDMNGSITKMLEIVTKKMEMIDQIALEDEGYNELYNELRKLNTALRAVIKVQYKIDATEKQNNFIHSLNSLDFKNTEEPAKITTPDTEISNA